MLLAMIQNIFEHEKMPKEWGGQCDRTNLQREIGHIQDCGNYRGIKMIAHAMEIWQTILDRRQRKETVTERTVRFRVGHSDNRCHICSQAGDGEIPGDAEETAQTGVGTKSVQ